MKEMFRVFGHDKIWVLDGGLPQWRASGYDVESSASGDAILKASAASEAIEKVYQGQLVAPTTFEAKLQPHLIWTLEQGEYKRRLDERDSQTTGEGSNHQFDNNIYLDVIGGVSKKGRIYGLGVEAGTLIPSSSTYEFEHCSASELETMRTTIAALTSELQQKENDVNEMREKLQQQEGKIEQQEGKI